jgi:predicted nucleic acid-binding protein
LALGEAETIALAVEESVEALKKLRETGFRISNKVINKLLEKL